MGEPRGIRDEIGANYRRYYRRLWSFARKLLVSEGATNADIDDLIHDTFAQAIEKVTEFYGEDAFGILSHILYHRFLDARSGDRWKIAIQGLVNRKTAINLGMDQWRLKKHTPPDQFEHTFLSEILSHIAKLPETLNAVLLAVAAHNDRHEAAESLGLSVHEMESRVQRAYVALHDLLGKEGLPEEPRTPKKYFGVEKTEGRKWRARIGYKKQMIELGSFDTARQAAKAYDAGLLKYGGDLKRLNFPEMKPEILQ